MPSFPSVEWFNALREIINHDEAYHHLGTCDSEMGIRVGERLLPDLVSELTWLCTGEMHLEDEWVAVAHALISRGQPASGGQSSLVACWT